MHLYQYNSGHLPVQSAKWLEKQQLFMSDLLQVFNHTIGYNASDTRQGIIWVQIIPQQFN